MAQGKEFKPTEKQRSQVKMYSAVGIPYKDIALKLDISDKTLVKYFSKELREGLVDANAKMGLGVYERGINGSVKDAHLWMKTRGGWKEIERQEHTGLDGTPLKINVVFKKKQ